MFWLVPAAAGMWAQPGESGVRNDLALLVDSGRIELPLSSWPIPRPDIEHVVAVADDESGWSPAESAALSRLRAWIEMQRREDGDIAVKVRLAAGTQPVAFRTFDSTPREKGEAGASVDWESDRWFGNLEVTGVSAPSDGQRARPDGTYVGSYLGQWYLTAGWLERWWGPGREGSLIFGTNARPMPGISFDRAASAPFESRWLAWLGPWTYSMFLSQMEGGRQDVSKALFFGQRLTLRPLPGLEIGLSRTAQFCGSGRLCNFNTFKNMLVGSDNRGDNVSARDEPGNQMAGFDVRWTPSRRLPLSLYSQWIGEDQQGGVPFKYLGLIGAESWKGLASGSGWRVHVEFADTACSWYRARPIFGCAYIQSVFNVEGYRYRGRAIGDSIYADGREISAGFDWMDRRGAHWVALARRIDLNRGGVTDQIYQPTTAPRRVSVGELRYERDTAIGHVTFGAAFEEEFDRLAATTMRTGQGFLRIERGIRF